jgi:hypothetical protein
LIDCLSDRVSDRGDVVSDCLSDRVSDRGDVVSDCLTNDCQVYDV